MLVTTTENGVTIELVPQKMVDIKCDWGVGIGGSIWTSGLALVEHLESHKEDYVALFKDSNVFELGSGTGLVGLCIAELFTPKSVVLTDLESHQQVLKENVNQSSSAVDIQVTELNWDAPTIDSLLHPIDVIVGTDVAYAKELYNPLALTLNALVGPQTTVFLGMNRTDTELGFFRLLESYGMSYYKIPDSKLGDTYRNKDFGIILISRRLRNNTD